MLVGILLPVGAFGFGYFFKQDSMKTKTMGNTLVVDGQLGGTLSEEFNTTGLVPGDSIDKTIEIKPNCTAPSLLRVKVHPHWEGNENDSNNIKIKFKINNESKLKSNSSEAYWYKDDDGYLYYMGIVDSNIKIIDLIEGFQLEPGDNINDYQGKNINIKVDLDIVQAKYKAYSEKWGVDNANLKSELDKLCESISKEQ